METKPTVEYVSLLPEHKRVDLFKDETTGKYLGFAELIDVMPSLAPKGRTGDIALVQGARVSYDIYELLSKMNDKRLVEYLVEHYHTSPLEMAEVKFICCCPLFVFNQLVRHRSACITGDCRVHMVTPGKEYDTIEYLYNKHRKNIQSGAWLVFNCDEDNGEMHATRMLDIWQSGIKTVYKVTLEDGRTIKTTKEHRYLTNKGWMTLSKILSGRNIDKILLAVENKMEKVDYLNLPDHLRLFSRINSIEKLGKEMTYDIEVEGPYHNFVCNGFVVHNSVNCVSRRYTEIPEESFYIPELRVQDDVNKQGSVIQDVPDELRHKYETMYQYANNTYKQYKHCVDQGIAKEVARGAMPQNIMTSFVWKMDLHNFLKMIQLRIHSTAQKEIQELAQGMYNLVKPIFPIACGAFEKFWLNKMTLAEDEAELIRQGPNEHGEYGKLASKRRQAAFEEKLQRLGLKKKREPNVYDCCN